LGRFLVWFGLAVSEIVAKKVERPANKSQMKSQPLIFAILALLPAAAFGQTKTDGPIKTTLCEVVAHPERFDGKVVQIRATVVIGFEKRLVVENACSAKVWLADAAVRQDEEYRLMEGLIRNQFDGKHDASCFGCPSYAVVATMTGRFDHVIWLARIIGHGFGHLNGWDSELLLQSVLDVVAKPIDRSVYMH
jgi:hypothetical protein